MTIARLATRQYGVVTSVQLRHAGLRRGAVEYRLRIGRLHRVHWGVYAVGHTRLSHAGRCLAAALSLGPDAVVSHSSAAVLWGLLADRGAPAHVTVARNVHARLGVRVHTVRHLDFDDRTRRARIPVTTVARTLLDLADTASEPALRRAVREAHVQRLVDEPTLRVQLQRAHGRRGAPRLDALIQDGPAPTRSELEDRMLALLRSHGFPQPLVNTRLPGFPRRMEPDFLFPDRGLVIEADGERYHDNRLARRDDATKMALLEAAGYRVVRVNWHQLTAETEQTVRRLRRVFAARWAAF